MGIENGITVFEIVGLIVIGIVGIYSIIEALKIKV